MRRFRFPLFTLVILLLVTLAGRRVEAQTESTFYVFCSAGGEDCTDGEEPTYGAQLIQAADGNLWGVTQAAGTAGNIEGWGTLYKISPAGKYTVVHAFCSEGSGACTDGGIPKGGLVQGPDGSIYGTTSFTGAAGGTVFKATPGGTFTTIYTFCVAGGSCVDGSLPEGGLIIGTDGNLYGVTYYGGSGGGGTIYKLTLTGTPTMTILHNFGAENDQSDPEGLVQATDGNFYGTTTLGGTNPTGTGQGTVFKMTPSGTYTTIYSFCQIYQDGICQDGRGPAAETLVETASGVLEGTTEDGGSGNQGSTDTGTIFTVTLAGSEGVVWNYCSSRNTNNGCSDGFHPYTGGFIASDGNFYTDTANGGAYGMGAISTGGASPVYSFCEAGMPCMDGYLPWAPPIQDSNGNLYGTTAFGGPAEFNAGVIWKINAGLPAPVQLTLNPTTVAPNSATTLTWKTLNAFSETMQQCYAFVQGSPTGAGTWTGKQTGSYSSSTKLLTGSATITPTVAGTYTYALTCGGIESGFATLTVSGTSKSSSATTLTASPNPATVGQSVSLKATVTGASGTPTGSVSFAVEGVHLGTANLSSGVATFTASTNGQAPGNYPVIATYGGSSTYDESASKALTVPVNKAPTATTLVISPTSVTPPGTATFTATVKRSASGATGTPTGSVTFYADGSVVVGTVKMVNGVATLTASSKGIPAAKYTITAKYLGDGSDVGSTSAGVAVTVK